MMLKWLGADSHVLNHARKVTPCGSLVGIQSLCTQRSGASIKLFRRWLKRLREKSAKLFWAGSIPAPPSNLQFLGGCQPVNRSSALAAFLEFALDTPQINWDKRNMNHNPQYQYDCPNCKFSWCCGRSCDCSLRRDNLPLPPKNIQNIVIRNIMKLNPHSSRESVRLDLFGAWHT